MTAPDLAPRVSVIGLGNVLLGDDGVGCAVVEQFRSEYECRPEIEILDLGAPGLDLAPYLYGQDLVVVVDAVEANSAPGTVRTYAERDLVAGRAPLRLTDHDPGLHTSLAQLRLIDRAPGELIVVGIVPESCDLGGGLGQVVSAAIATAIATIADVLRERGIECRRRSTPARPNLWWAHA